MDQYVHVIEELTSFASSPEGSRPELRNEAITRRSVHLWSLKSSIIICLASYHITGTDFERSIPERYYLPTFAIRGALLELLPSYGIWGTLTLKTNGGVSWQLHSQRCIQYLTHQHGFYWHDQQSRQAHTPGSRSPSFAATRWSMRTMW